MLYSTEITIACQAPGCNNNFIRKAKEIKAHYARGRQSFFCSIGCVATMKGHLKQKSICELTQCNNLTTSKFCSRSCAAQHNNSLRKRKLCKTCLNKPRDIKQYCQSCWDLMPHRGGFSAKDDDSTLAELKIKYSTSQYHAKIRGRSRAVYKSSGKPMTCKCCGYNLHVDIAHIKSVKDFSTHTPLKIVNEIQNLVALCKNHHWEFDNGYLTL